MIKYSGMTRAVNIGGKDICNTYGAAEAIIGKQETAWSLSAMQRDNTLPTFPQVNKPSKVYQR